MKRYLICGGDEPEDIAKNYRGLFPDKVEDKISQADLICEHIFDLLGSGPINLATHSSLLIDQKKTLSTVNHEPKTMNYIPIDWHSDFKSGYRWNLKTFYRDIRYGNIEGIDVKVPWELSRFQCLNILGQAYVLTKNQKYSEEFANQITDWIKNNPVGFGVNWHSTMDVAVRAADWLVAMEYFSGGDVFLEDFLEKFYVSIYEHGKFIRSHLEYSHRLTYNHYTANIAGLFFIAVYCPFLKESKGWLRFCREQLENEMQKQVYDDGCSFEASTSYHRLALELFFYAELLGKRAGVEFSEDYRNRLKKMFEFSLYCIKPNGKIPQIGDNDNGRLFMFSKRLVLDHTYLLSFASIYYKDSSFKLPEFNFDEEAFWIFGEEGRKIYDTLHYRKKTLASKSFSNAGWYIIRHNNHYCFISCGPNGQNGRGGHAHNDKLSFELVIGGHDIIVDPGTYVYTSYPEERNRFRSTEYHNTIMFDNYEQNGILKKDIFSLPDRVKIKDVNLKETDDESRFEGKIRYLDFIHKRIIILNKKSCNWQIIDSISCLKTANAKLILHLSSDVFYSNGYLLSRKINKKIVSIKVEGYEIEKGEYDCSPEYGVGVKAEGLSINIPVAKDIKTIILKA